MYTNQINHDPLSCLYYETLNKSITNIKTDSSTNRKLFSIDQLIQYIRIGWGVSTKDNKIKIKDGIYGALNAYI